MSLEHLVMPESKEAHKNEEDMSKRHRNQLEQISTGSIGGNVINILNKDSNGI